MKNRKTLRIGITPGDPSGIGPETALKAVNEIAGPEIIPVLIGGRLNIKKNYSSLAEDYTFISADSLEKELQPSKKYICELEYPAHHHRPGRGTVESALEALFCIDSAVDLWKKGLIDAVVTGPVHKGLIERAGVSFTGHTEYIAGRIGEDDPLMLMYSSDYRVILATTHIPLSEVTRSLDKDRLKKIITEGFRAIETIDGAAGTVALCGLDPHCGDEGAIGVFDTEVTLSAAGELRQEGFPLTGPLAADTLFIPDNWKKYSLAVAMYHDQGMIPFKMLSFEKGVNVTAGLSITRTSPDHGTAFDLAGKGTALYSSMKEAILLARDIEQKKRMKTGN